MTTETTTETPNGWAAVGSITVGLFAIVTVEILPIGLLTPMAQTFRISNGTAGLLMTAPGLLAAVAAPVVFSAVPLGSVLGVPLGTVLGNVAGWRAPFLAAGLLTTVTLIAVVTTLPRLAPVDGVTARELASLLCRRRVRTGLTATVLVVLAHFGTYTYVRPFLQDDAHLDSAAIAALLLTYGVAGIAGNMLAGRCAPQRPELVLGVASGAILVSLVTASAAAADYVTVALMVGMWGSISARHASGN